MALPPYSLLFLSFFSFLPCEGVTRQVRRTPVRYEADGVVTCAHTRAASVSACSHANAQGAGSTAALRGCSRRAAVGKSVSCPLMQSATLQWLGVQRDREGRAGG